MAPPRRTTTPQAAPAPRPRSTPGTPTRVARATRARPAAAGRRQLRRPDARAAHRGAQQQLRRFRQGTALAVALTALLLMLWGVPLDLAGQEPAQTTAAAPPDAGNAMPDPAAAVDEATSTIRELAFNFYAYLPRLLLVLLLLGIAAVLARIARSILERTLRGWERTAAVTAVTRLVIFLVAGIATLSILAGDVRAIVGSLGLLGLAASWALQTPIESFTGWLLNSFRGYYRVGDRISVGDVFGDVYRIDVLTTTVWEAGGAGKPVAAAQATGALITFPNWEVLRSNIINYSRDFPYVWDEITFNVANESDLGYCVEVIESTARRVLGEQMQGAAQRYDQLLRAERLVFGVEEVPRVYLSMADSWTDCTLRYLVPVRSRRHWSSLLTLEVSRELARPEHAGRVLPVYPRTEVTLHKEWPAATPPE
jgi:small conductance mechanosensitive channel